MDKKNDKQQMTAKEKASISVSFLSPLFFFFSSTHFLYLLHRSNVNQKNDKKIHFDQNEEKSALLFYVYVRSPIDNYENKKQTKVIEWTFISFVRSVSLLDEDWTVISHLFSFCSSISMCSNDRQTDRHSPAMIMVGEGEREKD